MVGYHTNECCSISSFATNHYIYTDDELRDVHWIADQYLTHAFHVAADNKYAFTSHFIGLEGDEIVLYMKVQSTDKLSVTRAKGAIKWYKTLCDLEAHLNTILKPLIWDVHSPTHHFVHKFCQTLPVHLCLGDNDSYYLDSAPFTMHCGVYQGTKPHIYRDPRDNKKTWV